MKIMKKILCMVFVVVLCLTSAPLSGFVGVELPELNWKASALASSGQCGENVYWNFDSSTGELVISGTGDMIDDGKYFYYNESIENIVIDDGVTSIGEGVFQFCENLKSVTIGCSVKTIGRWAFFYCDQLVDITIPDSVTTIGKDAFADCYSLTSAVVGDGVTSIEEGAFQFCENLESVTLSDNLICLGDNVFYECHNLMNITIPSSVTTIGSGAFYRCDSLKSITIPDSVINIGVAAFEKCNSLKSIYVDSKNNIYSNDDEGVLFDKNKKTLVCYPAGKTSESYSVSDGVVTIGVWAFSGCINIKSVILPNSVETIKEYSFANCDNLKKIEMSNNVTSIGECAFAECYNLCDLIIPDSVVALGSLAFEHCNSLISIKIPGSINSIDDDAFFNCRNLISVNIGNGVKTIGCYAFAFCDNLTDIIIPNSVITVDEMAFYDSVNITDIYYIGTETEWNDTVIKNGNDPLLNATIHFLGEEECDHNLVEKTIPASCTVNGMKFHICSECGDTIGKTEIIPASHTPGEWETVLEPTYEAEGKRIKKCTVCGETVDEEIIPKLEMGLVEDEKTGVGIEFPAGNYDGKVEIEVSESFDGTAFNILDTKTGAMQQKIYDIKMLVNGEEAQPNGIITVRIPLPAGYNPKFSFVYYVNTETNDLEKMNATYEDGYMVFETDHFSYYAIIAEPDTDNCSCSCHAGGIKGFFFKLILFFQKIFRTNKVCKCGIAHY